MSNALSATQPLRRRRSSHLTRWIHEQQKQPVNSPVTAEVESLVSIGTKSNPYLAYPHLSKQSLHAPSLDDTHILSTYDIVDHYDLHEEPHVVNTTHRAFSSSNLLEPPSIHNHSDTASASSISRNPSRMSILPHYFNPSTPHCMVMSSKHKRSSSTSTVNIPGLETSQVHPTIGASPKTWRWRPSVLGHFSAVPTPESPSSPDSDTNITPSRPSLSSSSTHTSITPPTTMFVDVGIPCTPSKVSLLNSIRLRNRSSNSRWLSPSRPKSESSRSDSVSHATETHGSSASGSTSALGHQGDTIRVSPKSLGKSRLAVNDFYDESEDFDIDPRPLGYDPSRPHVAYSSPSHRGTLSRMSMATLGNSTKKRKLVVSGIAAHDVRRFEGVKRWCESFGEVRQITRMPNGDLHVHFRKAEVADTVCRLRAKVYISGVGSVYLSWLAGNK